MTTSLYDVARRGFIRGTVGTAAVGARPSDAQSATGAGALPPHTAEPLDIVLEINRNRVPLTIEPRTSLLDALRENAGLMGTTKGCGRGACGARTVHVDGRRVVSCLMLAARCQGKSIITIEGLTDGGALHPVQAAFLHHDGIQCGYCTPGQIMSAVSLIKEGHAGSDAEIREWMSGNICRCGAYPNIVAAIRDVSRED
jgi:xanthine dehydrogenase YagT iron-sulfur-binding subunit